MTIKEYFVLFSNSLVQLYDRNESESITKWIFEDYFKNQEIDYRLQLSRPLEEIDLWMLSEKLGRLVGGEPIQYIIGTVDFLDVKIDVNPSVLIPRPETEFICFELIKILKMNNFSGSILDLCSGSGVIAIGLKSAFPNSEVTGLDISISALKTAELNSKKNSLEVNFIQFDVLGDSLKENFDLIISNPPYVLEKEKLQMHKNVLNFEPPLALFVKDDDQIVFYKKIIDMAINHLNDQGYLIFELNPLTANQVKEYATQIGLKDISIFQDLRGMDRMLLARKK